MASGDKVYPEAETEFTSAPPPPGSYYNVKDQQLPPPATYRRPGRGRSPCCCCLGTICSIFATLVGLIAIATFLFWIVVQPRAPRFNVENVRISGLDSSSSTSSPVNTGVVFQLMARNPNKHVGIYYDHIHLNVQTSGVTIGDGDITPFYQGHKNTTVINTDLQSDGVTFNSGTLAGFTGSDATNVPLYVKVDVNARVKVGSWKSRKMTIRAHCNLNVDLTIANGSQLTHSDCKVTRF